LLPSSPSPLAPPSTWETAAAALTSWSNDCRSAIADPFAPRSGIVFLYL
jgi:hypothetical protein